MALDLCDAKNKIFDYVESRMFFLSPNLTHICGANTAAKMMGGLVYPAKIWTFTRCLACIFLLHLR